VKKTLPLSVAAPLAVVAAAIAFAAIVAAVARAEIPHHTVVRADDIKWGPAPPSLPPGAQAAVLYGNPQQEGPFVLRLKFPAGFLIPPHRHSKDELVTVISGKVAIMHGEKVDRTALQTLAAASFVRLPAGMPHYAAAEVESVVQINSVGPFDVIYINAADDPRTSKR
jgi:hypothetical protein